MCPRERQTRRSASSGRNSERVWRRAPFFASARRGAPQKSAKRKRKYAARPREGCFTCTHVIFVKEPEMHCRGPREGCFRPEALVLSRFYYVIVAVPVRGVSIMAMNRQNFGECNCRCPRERCFKFCYRLFYLKLYVIVAVPVRGVSGGRPPTCRRWSAVIVAVPVRGVSKSRSAIKSSSDVIVAVPVRGVSSEPLEDWTENDHVIVAVPVRGVSHPAGVIDLAQQDVIVAVPVRGVSAK